VTPRGPAVITKPVKHPAGAPSISAMSNMNQSMIWFEDVMADRLGAVRGPGESYSEVILRLVGMKGACAT
jgi:hypothetical protein